MYIKLKNGQIEKYPYSIDLLKKDNTQTSFPEHPSKELLAEWNVYVVIEKTQPLITYKQNITEGIPELVNDEWTQTWVVTNKLQEEIDELNKQFRSEDYRQESDPLFFKWQRGEATQQEWLDKVNEIKQRWS